MHSLAGSYTAGLYPCNKPLRLPLQEAGVDMADGLCGCRRWRRAGPREQPTGGSPNKGGSQAAPPAPGRDGRYRYRFRR